MEYKMKCNVCGKVFCYTDEDLKRNATNAGLGALTALGSLASTLGGGTVFHTHHLQGQSDRYTDKVIDYSQCPYCHSRNLSCFTGNVEDSKVVKTVNINTSASAESLLKRAFMFLEDSEWETADAYCEACLDKDPELANAYLGKLMAELHISEQGKLRNQQQPFDDNPNYRKAMRYADDGLRNTLIDYINHINNRNENTRKDKILHDAKSKMIGTSVANFEEAAKLFASISGWKDADEQKSICHSKIVALKAKEETDRLERKRLAEIERKKAEEEAEAARIKVKKATKIAIILTPILAVLIAVAVLISNSFEKKKEEAARLEAYNAAVVLMDAGQYEKAIKEFKKLDGYKDSSEQIKIAESAIAELERMAELEAQYNNAINLLESDVSANENEAYYILKALGDYKDSEEIVQDFCYAVISEVVQPALSSVPVETLYEYDSHGWLVKQKESDGDNSTYTYDNEGRIIRKIQNDGTIETEYSYHENGMRKRTLTKTRLGTVMTDFDMHGSPIKGVYTYQGITWEFSYTYTENGNISVIDCLYRKNNQEYSKIIHLDEYGENITLSYEPDDILPVFKSRTSDREEVEYIISYDYFDGIQLTENYIREYDSNGNLISEKYGIGKDELDYNYCYDANGNLIQNIITFQTGEKTQYDYSYGYIYIPEAT